GGGGAERGARPGARGGGGGGGGGGRGGPPPPPGAPRPASRSLRRGAAGRGRPLEGEPVLRAAKMLPRQGWIRRQKERLDSSRRPRPASRKGSSEAPPGWNRPAERRRSSERRGPARPRAPPPAGPGRTTLTAGPRQRRPRPAA